MSDSCRRGPRAVGVGRARRLRMLAVASLVAGAGALVAGVVHAFLTLNGSGTGFAATGSVGLGTPASTQCTFSNMAPGDLSGSRTCSFAVTYTGSLSAYVSLTVRIQAGGGAGAGRRPLYDGSNTSGLTLRISDGHTSFTVPTDPGTTGGSCPSGDTCWTASNELAAAYSGNTPNLAFSSGDTATFTVTPLFATSAGNAYQGGSATVALTVQAVQSGANALPAGCTTSTIGKPCPASGTFTWS